MVGDKSDSHQTRKKRAWGQTPLLGNTVGPTDALVFGGRAAGTEWVHDILLSRTSEVENNWVIMQNDLHKRTRSCFWVREVSGGACNPLAVVNPRKQGGPETRLIFFFTCL